MSDDPVTVLAAECPMSWCEFVAVVEAPEDPYVAAYEVEDHVNNDHSQKDLETLIEQADDTEVEFDP